MAGRFIEAHDELIELLKSESENKNTKRSSDYWKGIFEKWAKNRDKEKQLESYDIPKLNKALSQFYAELRKENGKDYDSDSLKVMQAALERHLRSQNYPKSILRNIEFLSSRKVLEEKAKKLREQGMGKRSTQQSKEPNEGRRGDTMGKRSVRQPNPSFFDKHNVVAANNVFWFTWSTRAPRHDGRRFFYRKG